MLSPEVAHRQLENAARDQKDVHSSVKALPGPARRVAWSLLGRAADGRVQDFDWDRDVKVARESTEWLDAQRPAGRGRVWSAFFPRLDVRLFERTWQSLRSAPYSLDYHRLPFRAPGDLAATRDARHGWLESFVQTCAEYHVDLDWLAAWAGHLDRTGTVTSPLLAAAIDEGGKPGATVLQTLRDSASGAHPIGIMGTHVVRTLLTAGNAEGWEFIERLLLAAQRQEGLRQSILETVGGAHPAAFRRVLRLIIANNLVRFSATVRAVDVWLGYAWDFASVKVVNSTLERLLRYLDDAEARAQAVASGAAEDAYLALWATAFEDAHAAAAAADTLRDDPNPDRRFVAVHLLAEVAARTALGAADLVEGAVDVAWFHRVYQALGPKRWAVLDEAAKYASSGSGHARARLFATAMLGKVKQAELTVRVTSKRNADALRALGLLPLARGTARERDMLDRYKVTQEFVRTSKQFGAQRQASEKRAAAIALDNLARTAGYPDPVRLEWAMEANAIADLARGAVAVAVEGVTVTLALDDLGQPDLTASRAGRVLKAIPAAVKKHKTVAALAARRTELRRQAARVRQSLEAAMCRGDGFTGDELKQLAGHALLWPLLSRLVLVGEGIAGYPDKKGRALRGHGGTLEPVKAAERLRVAHPHDLLGLGDWHHWQRECFRAERIQPFKQVFRELYVLTRAEKAEGTRSLRYAGHQVNPSQALALLGSRGWVNHPYEGTRKTFHEAGLTAAVNVMGLTFSPADVEGFTMESVHFVKRNEWKPVPLDQIPPRLFSEVMRDLDLVVSVAHRGGVDPEASASTVDMRGSLLRETCALLGLKNVRVQNAHALIEGQLGHYSLHLGSGVVHRQPGGALCIVPVHAQHRGRLFLPFADDDPRTAEVLSKALLLARDGEIQDPTILAQIQAAS